MNGDPRWRGIARHGAGWRATVSRGRHHPRVERHFAHETELEVMQAWRRDEQARLRLERKQRAFRGTFEGDARAYLRLVAGLITFKDRQREIAVWIGVFGTTPRDRITAGQIRAVRDRWLTEPRGMRTAIVDGRRLEVPLAPLAAGTVNKRLRALSNLYRLLDGHRADNPVREVPEAREPAPIARALDYETIERILAELGTVGRADKGKKRADSVSLSRLRLRCLAYCQITPIQLGALTPADVDLEGLRIRLPARRKGRGVAALWTGLLPRAVEAFRDFDAAQAYGKFSQSSLRKAFKRAAAKLKITASPYALRHAFGTMAYEALGQLEPVAKLMQHTSTRTTIRYALAAEQRVIDAHFVRLARHIGATSTGNKRNEPETSGHSAAPSMAADEAKESETGEFSEQKVGGR